MSTSTSSPGAIASHLYGAVLAGDLDEARRFLDDDVVLHVPGSHPLAGEHRGAQGFLQFVVDSRALTETGERIELIDMLEGVDHAAAYCRITAERPGRAPLDNTTVHVLRMRDGKLAEAWLHNWDDAAVDEFWS